jgi:hypothetical protein
MMFVAQGLDKIFKYPVYRMLELEENPVPMIQCPSEIPH